MKFIKYAVGLVIALSVIPLVVITVNNLDQPKLRTVTFEVIDYDIETSQITVSENTYTDLYNVPIIQDVPLTPDEVTNLVSVKLNTNIIEVSLQYFNDSTNFELLGYWYIAEMEMFSDGYSATIGDKWEMTFEVPSPTPPLIKLLVGFAPLLFVGGILLFMLNKRKFD